ncbi:MAG: hypothetical protein GY758_00290 [Fuerstiella sp.]|jgi:chromosome segregation ATPase|nr:hypothetical protein [Fuerstiella sp.]MDG2128210.1 hypothetical protein [Fuerstiella sp.]
MKTKQIFFNAATICMVSLAVLMTQAMFDGSANAGPQVGERQGENLKQRVADLEDRQDEDKNEFFLVDQSLDDLVSRVNRNDGRLVVHSADIRALQARVKKAEERISVQRADHRSLVSKVAEMRVRPCDP